MKLHPSRRSLFAACLLALCATATLAAPPAQTPAPAAPTQAAQPERVKVPAPAPVFGGNQGRHAQLTAAVKKEKFDLVLIGDSITHTLDHFGGKYAALEAVWNKHYAPRHALNLGSNGYRTENILWNLQNGEFEGQTPKVAVLLIGTNNADGHHFPKISTPEEICAGTQAIVEEIQARSPATKILILRLFPKGGEDQKGTSEPVFHFSPKEIETARRAGELTKQLADGKRVFWLDVGHVFLRADGSINTDLMPDLLHPNAAGAEAWAQAIEPTLAQLMGDKPIVDAPKSPAPGAFLKDLAAGKKITVVTMGTSLTGGTWRWPDVMVGEWLNKDYPGQVQFFNEGVGASASGVGPGGNVALSGLGKLPAVLARKPDVVFIEFTTNDAYLPYKISPEDSKKNLNKIIDAILAANPKTEIILQTMNAVKDNPKAGAGNLHASTRPRLAEYAEDYRQVAQERGVALVDHYPHWLKLMQEQPELFDKLVPDRIHPQAEGYRTVVLPELKRAMSAGK